MLLSTVARSHKTKNLSDEPHIQCLIVLYIKFIWFLCSYIRIEQHPRDFATVQHSFKTIKRSKERNKTSQHEMRKNPCVVVLAVDYSKYIVIAVDIRYWFYNPKLTNNEQILKYRPIPFMNVIFVEQTYTYIERLIFFFSCEAKKKKFKKKLKKFEVYVLQNTIQMLKNSNSPSICIKPDLNMVIITFASYHFSSLNLISRRSHNVKHATGHDAS